jgi:hypothetical protein
MAQKAGKRRIRNREQVQKALDLRTAGGSYDAIGKQMGVSKTRAYQLVMEGLAELETDIKETAGKVRELELRRLDAIVLAHWTARQNPRSAEILLKASNRRSELLGLDAPTRLEQSGPSGGPMTIAVSELDLASLSTEELRELEGIITKAGSKAEGADPET